MAEYELSAHLRRVSRAAFDYTFHATYPSASRAPYSGLYRCRQCGYEIVATKGQALPTQENLPHWPRCTAVAWQLLVATDNQP